MKKVIFLLIGLVAFSSAIAQQASFFNASSGLSETVVNTGTAFLTTRIIPDLKAKSTVVQVNVTKVSGTVGGTITLLGSIDGTNYVALRTVETQTALATITATDATASYHWRLTGSHFLYYRVSYTGTGTMNATFTAQYFRNKE